MSDRYLLDTVTLSKMTSAQRSSAFTRAWCRVPTPVLHEAQWLQDATALGLLAYDTTIEVLRHVSAVVESLTTSDRLLDLYRNEGNGDVFLLAVALAETEAATSQLFGDNWIIVTDDIGLTRKAAEFGIATYSSARFKELLCDGADLHSAPTSLHR